MPATSGSVSKVLAKTLSLCPECLRRIPAFYITGNAESDIFISKDCPEHGHFQTPVWSGAPDFLGWYTQKPLLPLYSKAHDNRGCPYECGLCREHRQHSCCVLLEVTQNCDLNCPLCFASAGNTGSGLSPDPSPNPSPDDLGRLMDGILAQAGNPILQLSGGEPTTRDDLPGIIRLAKQKGFSFIQLNTNGLRLGTETHYAAELAEAGLSVVYLQFDALKASSLLTIRGRNCLTEKKSALRAALAAQLPVVLVATVVPQANDGELGDLLRLALAEGSGVRGLHLQPAAYFGRYPKKLSAKRTTLSGVMQALAEQSAGLIKLTDFRPNSGEHELCAFSALYSRTPDGGLQLHQTKKACCSAAAPDINIDRARDGAEQCKAFTTLNWRHPAKIAQIADDAQDDFDKILATSGLDLRFTISAMAFQDAFSLDLDRLQQCCVHVADKKGALVPFCAYNLTGIDGQALYRGVQGR
ncbi:MAG: radical SAM protein [Deltaproteobacteria bacterium]|jgi:uncharacterized radical SAM superfamily Fe-S cluster-containing enzyme|nr:radical SAM protein [Deltaproteobacteria bacterium]